MNEQPTDAWNPKQERLAVLIAAGRSIKDAAAELEIGERTAHTWLEDPRYRALIAELRHRMMDEAVGTLVEATNEAVGTLKSLLNDGNGNVRLRAATSILESAVRLREHVELDARLLQIETERARGTAEPPRRIRIPDYDDRYPRTDPKGWDEGTERTP